MTFSNFGEITFSGHTAGPKKGNNDNIDGSVVVFGKDSTNCSLDIAVNSKAYGEDDSHGRWMGLKFFGQAAENIIYNFGEDGALNDKGVPVIGIGVPFFRPYRGKAKDPSFDYEGDEEFDDDVFVLQEGMDVNMRQFGLDLMMTQIDSIEYNKVKRRWDGDDDSDDERPRSRKGKGKGKGSSKSRAAQSDDDDEDAPKTRSRGGSGRSGGRSSSGGRSGGSSRTRSGGRSSSGGRSGGSGRSSRTRSRSSSDDE